MNPKSTLAEMVPIIQDLDTTCPMPCRKLCQSSLRRNRGLCLLASNVRKSNNEKGPRLASRKAGCDFANMQISVAACFRQAPMSSKETNLKACHRKPEQSYICVSVIRMKRTIQIMQLLQYLSGVFTEYVKQRVYLNNMYI